MNINKELIKETINKYGNLQLIVCMEELAELTQAISKELRGKHNQEHLLEEVSDVYLMLENLKLIYNLTDEDIEKVIKEKQERTKNG